MHQQAGAGGEDEDDEEEAASGVEHDVMCMQPNTSTASLSGVRMSSAPTTPTTLAPPNTPSMLVPPQIDGSSSMQRLDNGTFAAVTTPHHQSEDPHAGQYVYLTTGGSKPQSRKGSARSKSKGKRRAKSPNPNTPLVLSASVPMPGAGSRRKPPTCAGPFMLTAPTMGAQQAPQHREPPTMPPPPPTNPNPLTQWPPEHYYGGATQQQQQVIQPDQLYLAPSGGPHHRYSRATARVLHSSARIPTSGGDGQYLPAVSGGGPPNNPALVWRESYK